MTPTSSEIEHRALRLALDLAAAEDCRISATALYNHYGTEADHLIRLGLLRPEGQVSSVEARDGTLASIVWSPERGESGYFDHEEGWVGLGLEDAGMYCLHIRELVRSLTAKFSLQPSGTFRELRPGLLWDLGLTRLSGQRKLVSIWVVRRLHDPEVQVRLQQAVHERPAPDHRLILNLSGDETRVPLPANLTLSSVSSLASTTTPLTIDADIASARLKRPVGTTEAVQMSADGGHLVVRDRDYLFRGQRQRAIVRQLYEAWELGNARILTSTVLTEAESGLSVRRLASVFKGHSNWHEVIKEEAGFCWLEV